MPKITIIYRVCDSVDMINGTVEEPGWKNHEHSLRFYDIPKFNLIRKCMSSVKDAMDAVTNISGKNRVAMEFICVYDRCSEETLGFIKGAVPDAKMICSNGSGNVASFLTCAEIANSMADDSTIVYFLEDDYSFLSTDGLIKAIRMLESASANVGRRCALFLDDYPDRYEDGWLRRGTDVVLTPYGHLMRIDKCTYSFMTYVGVVKEHFNDITAHDENNGELLEKNGLDKVWKEVPLFCPLPGLTLHCQLRCHIPRYLNVDEIKRIMES